MWTTFSEGVAVLGGLREPKGTVAVRKVSGVGSGGGRFDFFPERQLGALGA